MANRSTVLSQVLQFLPKVQFQEFVRKHDGDHRVRKLDCWTWFGALLFGQLTGHNSIRAIARAFQVTQEGFRTLGFGKVCRSTLADANERRPVPILEDTFHFLLGVAQLRAPKSKFRFHGPVWALDSTTISLCLELCPWARFHHGKGAFKLHTAIDLAGDLPQFAVFTEGRVHDIKAIRGMKFPAGTMLIVDRGYMDYNWLWSLTQTGVWFVTRMKDNCRYKVRECRLVDRAQGLRCDQTIVLSSQRGQEYPGKLRKVSYRDPNTGDRYTFLTNRFDLSAKTIAMLYKARWQVELFFKTLKQQLRVKKFVGTSVQSVQAQIWVALIAYLLVCLIRWNQRLNWSIPEVMAALCVTIFSRKLLAHIFHGAPTQRLLPPGPEQLSLWPT
jgi:putative transposase